MDHLYNRSAPQEPPVHGKGLALLSLVFGAYFFLSGLAIFFFPRNEAQLKTWWIAVLIGLALLGVAFLFFRRRRKELAAHEQWAADFTAWQQEQARIAHERELELLQKRLELEQAELARIKAQASAEFGGSTLEEIAVAGTSRSQDVIKSLGYENEEYRYTKRQIRESGLEDEHIEKLVFPELPVALVPDRENTHDSNAVKVLLSGEFVGYIPADSSARIRSLMDQGKILNVSARIVGGPYKAYDSLEDEIYKKDLYYGIRLDLRIRK